MESKEIVSMVLSIMPKTKEILTNGNTAINEKEGIGNIVTATDKKLEEYIKRMLLEKFPGSQVISEESAEETKLDNNRNLKFIVDPLDGTTNYTNGWPHAIAIGIANSNDLEGSVIYDVLSSQIYFAIKGKGAFICDIDDILKFKPITKPKYEIEDIKKAVISYDTPYGAEAFKITREMMTLLYHSGASLKTVGPISLDVLKTALGRENRPNDYNNAVWHTEVRAWDLAASTVILRELGGEIIGNDGKPLSLEKLTSPDERISFMASGNSKMLEKLYNIYIKSQELARNPQYSRDAR